ncbi:MAG: ABC transporter substrate-binding protein [Actinobacteria bacterium]|jgi:glucose/mannose transport system substrate-binding protein|nr:ABC transporter substrate-binding protein [Actinomycetota bacterium]
MLKKSKLAIVLAAVGALVATTVPASHAATNKQLEIFTWWASGGEAAGLAGMTTEFTKQNPSTPFINAAVAGAAGVNAKGVLVSRMGAGNPPDTFQAHAGAELSTYVKAGQVEDLTFLYKAEGWDKVFPAGLIKTLTTNGKIYSVPVNIHRANVLWWNPATATKAGVSAAPKTMEEFIADLAKAKKAGIDGIALAGNGDWAIAHLFDVVLLGTMGAAKYDGLWKGTTAWTSPEVAKAISNLSTILSYGNASKSLDWPDAGKLVTGGKALFFIMGDWASSQWQSDGLKLGSDYTWAPAPNSVDKKPVYMWLSDSFTLPKGAVDRDAGIAWLKVCGSLAGQDAFNPKKGSIAVRKDSNPALYDSYLQAAMKEWKVDTLVGSTVHGVNYGNAGMAAYDSAVGKFYTGGGKDKAGLTKALVAAYKANAAS